MIGLNTFKGKEKRKTFDRAGRVYCVTYKKSFSSISPLSQNPGARKKIFCLLSSSLKKVRTHPCSGPVLCWMFKKENISECQVTHVGSAAIHKMGAKGGRGIGYSHTQPGNFHPANMKQGEGNRWIETKFRIWEKVGKLSQFGN